MRKSLQPYCGKEALRYWHHFQNLELLSKKYFTGADNKRLTDRKENDQNINGHFEL